MVDAPQVKVNPQPLTPHIQTCLHNVTSIFNVQSNGFSICFQGPFKKDLDNFFFFFLKQACLLGQVAYTPMGMSPMSWLLRYLSDSLIYF